MANRSNLEIFVCVDSEGSLEADSDRDVALERFDENIRGRCRILKVTLKNVLLPEAEVDEEIEAEVKDIAGEIDPASAEVA
jgi:hypothetical protein